MHGFIDTEHKKGDKNVEKESSEKAESKTIDHSKKDIIGAKSTETRKAVPRIDPQNKGPIQSYKRPQPYTLDSDPEDLSAAQTDKADSDDDFFG